MEVVQSKDRWVVNYPRKQGKAAMFAALYGSDPYAKDRTLNYLTQSASKNPCKEIDLGTNSTFEFAVRNQDSLKSGDLEALAKYTAEKQAEAREEQAKVKLDELVKVTKWNRVDGGEGSLLSTFPKETKREMLNTLKMVKSNVPHKYKKAYSKNIDNKIAVLEYLLKE